MNRKDHKSALLLHMMSGRRSPSLIGQSLARFAGPLRSFHLTQRTDQQRRSRQPGSYDSPDKTRPLVAGRFDSPGLASPSARL